MAFHLAKGFITHSTQEFKTHLPIKTGRIGPAMDNGILARPGEDTIVGGPAVKTPEGGGRIITGRKLGLATTGAAPKDGVRSTNGCAPTTPPGGGPDAPPGTAGAGAMPLLILKGGCCCCCCCCDLWITEAGMGMGGMDCMDGATMSGGRCWMN